MSIIVTHFGLPIDTLRDASPKAPTVGKVIHDPLILGIHASQSPQCINGQTKLLLLSFPHFSSEKSRAKKKRNQHQENETVGLGLML